ncbi:MAG TPA: ABC transporter permease [Vicinamibacterales bacterium]|nr:ABC transporter permease [Vicinamibacterales bacterium]
MRKGPPRVVRWIVDRALPRDERGNAMRGDLIEEFRERGGSALWYWWHGLSVALRYARMRRQEKRSMRLESMWQDIRYAVRAYAKTPTFTLAVIATLALGIGASTAIFSMVNGILLEPLPLQDPSRLIYVNEVNPVGNRMSVAWPTYQDWVRRAQSVDALADSREEPMTLTGLDRPLRITARRVTANFFHVVGGHPALGRDFSADADVPNAAGEAIISDAFWRANFDASPSVVGRQVTLDAVPFTIVGVMPPAFQYIRAYDAFVTMGPISGLQQVTNRGNHSGFYAVGRLKPGVTAEAADREFKTIQSSLEREYPKTNAGISARVELLQDRVVSDIKLTLLALLGAVGCLLLIACVNVANLLIARGTARQHELAVRAAVGGSRARLTMQLLIESALVSLAGGLAGVAIAFALLRALVAVAPEGTPRIDAVHLNTTALWFAFGAAAASGLLFGLFPAGAASRVQGSESLRLRSSGASAGSHRVRRALIVVETALAIVLLVGAGLTMRTLQALTRVDTGFQPDHLVTMRVNLAGDAWTPARRLNFVTEVQSRVSAIPGVTRAAIAYSLPIDGSQWNSVFVAADKPEPIRAETPSAAMSPIGPQYFDALGMKVLAGRPFDARDSATSPRVGIINETLARRIWPGESAIGKRVKQGWYDSPESFSPWIEIVGVVGDVKFEGVTAETPMQLYLPLPQVPIRTPAIIVRTASDPASVVHAVEAIVHDIDKDLPVYSIRTMDQLLDSSIARQRMAMVVFAVFAGVALLLAAIGLYGVVAQGVTERTHEIGVRMALGADRRHVLTLVVRQGLSMALLGVVVGIVTAAALSRSIQSILFGVKPTDPITLVGVVGALLTVATIACCVPAWRASRVDPTQALRSE